MGRDLEQCRKFAASWYGGSLDCVSSEVSEQSRCENVDA